MTNKKARVSAAGTGSAGGAGIKRKRARKGRTAAVAEAGSSSSSSSSSSDDSSDDEQMADPTPAPVPAVQDEGESSSDDSSSSSSSSSSDSPPASRYKGKGKAKAPATADAEPLRPSRYSPEPESDEFDESSDSETDPYVRDAKRDLPREFQPIPIPSDYPKPPGPRPLTAGEKLWHERRRKEKEERLKREEENSKIDAELDREAFEKLWMDTVTEEFKDELLEINKREPGLASDPARMGMLINSLAYLGKRDDDDIAFLLHGKYNNPDATTLD